MNQLMAESNLIELNMNQLMIRLKLTYEQIDDNQNHIANPKTQVDCLLPGNIAAW